MPKGHDFKNFPELTDRQMQIYYFESPHKQITRNFEAKVTKVIDGDTIRVKTTFRDFDFKVRLADIAAPEVKERGGKESKRWLEKAINNQTVYVLINPDNRVGKWGRLLGNIFHAGFNINEESVNRGYSVAWEDRDKTPLIN